MKRVVTPLYGPRGIRVRIRGSHVYVGGSDHWMHWLHHVLPGARRREIQAGHDVAVIAEVHGITAFWGHSIGGCIAQIAASLTPDASVRTYGTKRAPRGYTHQGEHYRHRGDFVPWLPPWRPRVACEYVGDYLPIWVAHHPRTYRELLE